MDNKINILYVDDEKNNLIAFKAYFRKHERYRLFLCGSGEEGLKILEESPIHVIIADQKMPNMTGVEFLAEAVKNHPEPVRIVVTAHRDLTPLEVAFQEGKIFRYHDKPWNLDDVEASIEDAYKEYCKNVNPDSK